jgi:hypothetical protein
VTETSAGQILENHKKLKREEIEKYFATVNNDLGERLAVYVLERGTPQNLIKPFCEPKLLHL